MKDEKIWVQNFKKFLTSEGMEAYLPEKVIKYIDGFMEKIKSQRQEIEVLKEEKRKLLKTLDEYSKERAEAVNNLGSIMIRNNYLESKIKVDGKTMEV
jgi:division protein CdvB (Snf7/Vps24/ESCRT-III family)